MSNNRKAKATKVVDPEDVYLDNYWRVCHGQLKRGKGNPGNTPHLFRVVGEKIPFIALASVKKHLQNHNSEIEGVYVAHDSMGCPRYIGRGKIFSRLDTRRRASPRELVYFSFYVVADKKHEREIETLLIRSAEFVLELNQRKKRVGIAHADVKDFEAGTFFYERRDRKGS